jgi:predicted glycoside hydrolase/deacetylase ChbG (UPF0249 family)
MEAAPAAKRTDMAMPDLISIALCADDYALSPGVDDGILSLAARDRITALSCMTASVRWFDAAQKLKPFFGRVDIGLHFALTQLAPLGPLPALAPNGRLPSLRDIYLIAMRRAIDPDEVEAELTRQLDAFSQATGRRPDFLDGHHHVHQLPVIREVVARVWRSRAESGWIRNTATPPGRIFTRGVAIMRAMLLAAFGSAAGRAWRTAGIGTNADFAGVRSFIERKPFRELMRRYLVGAQPGLLIMCHPGWPDDTLAQVDSVTTTRADELAYLGGDAFPVDLVAAGCRLERISVSARRRMPSGSD